MHFDSDVTDFQLRTRKRFHGELFMLLAIGTFLYCNQIQQWMPNWVPVGIFIFVLVYSAIDIAMYPKSKSFAESCEAKLTPKELKFSISGMTKKIPLNDIVEVEAQYRRGKVVGIKLHLKNSEIFDILNLENLNLLYESLTPK